MNESQLRTKVDYKCRGEKDKRSGDVEVLQLRSLVPYVYGISEIVVWNVPSTSGNAHYGVASTDTITPHGNNMMYTFLGKYYGKLAILAI